MNLKANPSEMEKHRVMPILIQKTAPRGRRVYCCFAVLRLADAPSAKTVNLG